VIEPSYYQKRLEGKSNAHRITFNDGNDYAVKFFQPGFERTLPNEWVGYCLARYLHLPIPFGRIIDVQEDFLIEAHQRERDEHAEEGVQVVQSKETVVGVLGTSELEGAGKTRYQFASLFVPNCVDGHQVSEVSSLTNSTMLAGIILFDYWLANQDRTLKNILFQKMDEGVYTLWAIDHAEVLGGFSWSQADLEVLPEGIIKSSAHKMMAVFIESEEEFYEQLEVIQTMPILLMEEIVNLIPEEWGVSKEDRKAIVTTLLHRRNKVLPKLIERFINKVYRPIKAGNG
jgi:hypothetical protein